MSDALSRYLLFLAETITLLVALAALLVFVAGLARRGRARPRLKVENLNDRFEDLDLAMRAALTPGKAAKQRRREAKQRRKARGSTPPGSPSERPRVFVVDFAGDPRASGVDALREEITAVLAVAGRQDEVLLRLKNPGGFVHDQGLAASQLLRLRSRGVPLVVAVDTVAASGGYLMACVADRIVAAPFAIVGSIGVVTQVPNVNRLLERHGVDVEQFTAGRFKRTVTMLGPTTDEGREKLQEQLDEVHVLFKDWVARYRPQLDLDAVGTGEYWYGSRALELGLVDELATSDEYLLSAARRVDVFKVTYTPPRSPARRFGSALSAAGARLVDRTA